MNGLRNLEFLYLNYYVKQIVWNLYTIHYVSFLILPLTLTWKSLCVKDDSFMLWYFFSMEFRVFKYAIISSNFCSYSSKMSPPLLFLSSFLKNYIGTNKYNNFLFKWNNSRDFFISHFYISPNTHTCIY